MKNNYKSSILNFVRSLGLPIVGIAGDGTTYSKIVCLFPYFTGNKNMGNLSMYTYGLDYHKITEKYLTQIENFIRINYPFVNTKVHVDIGEGDDKKAAYLAGLGFFGKNSLLINPTYGSFVFIGYVETDLILTPDTPLEETCLACGKCMKACPGGAIQNGKIDVTKCASSLSQKKGELSEEETAILKRSGLIWGCDICQTVCPHNKEVPLSPMQEFYENLIFSLSTLPETNKEFHTLYGDRAFTWRGKAVLKRNLEILSTHERKSGGHTM